MLFFYAVEAVVMASTHRGWLETLEAGCIFRGGCIPTPRGRPVSSDTHHPSLYTGSTNGHGINKWTTHRVNRWTFKTPTPKIINSLNAPVPSKCYGAGEERK